MLIAVIILSVLSYYIYNKEYSQDYGHKVVICIPVYGQSYALGEEAKRITDFDSLRIKYNGRIVTEKLDYTLVITIIAVSSSSGLKGYCITTKRLLRFLFIVWPKY